MGEPPSRPWLAGTTVTIESPPCVWQARHSGGRPPAHRPGAVRRDRNPKTVRYKGGRARTICGANPDSHLRRRDLSGGLPSRPPACCGPVTTTGAPADRRAPRLPARRRIRTAAASRCGVTGLVSGAAARTGLLDLLRECRPDTAQLPDRAARRGTELATPPRPTPLRSGPLLARRVPDRHQSPCQTGPSGQVGSPDDGDLRRQGIRRRRVRQHRHVDTVRPRRHLSPAPAQTCDPLRTAADPPRASLGPGRCPEERMAVLCETGTRGHRISTSRSPSNALGTAFLRAVLSDLRRPSARRGVRPSRLRGSRARRYGDDVAVLLRDQLLAPRGEDGYRFRTCWHRDPDLSTRPRLSPTARRASRTRW